MAPHLSKLNKTLPLYIYQDFEKLIMLNDKDGWTNRQTPRHKTIRKVQLSLKFKVLINNVSFVNNVQKFLTQLAKSHRRKPEFEINHGFLTMAKSNCQENVLTL